MRSWWVVVVVLVVAGCRTQPLGFNCSSDSQCGSGGTCIGGACAFVDATCPSGYRLDQSAGGAAGQCVPVVVDVDAAAQPEIPDMSAAVVVVDMAAAPPDLAPPPDLTLTCAQQGHPCTVGTGACKSTGTIVCNPSPACNATAGDPSDTFATSQAPNGSWDWNCSGTIDQQYPTVQTFDCKPLSQAACGGVWYLWSNADSSCGQTITRQYCQWDQFFNACAFYKADQLTQGCK